MPLKKDGPLVRMMYEGWMSQFKPFRFETEFSVSMAYNIDFLWQDILIEASYFPEHFYRVRMPIDDIAGASNYYHLCYMVGEQAGKYFRSIELPLGDNIVLGEN